MKTSVGYNGASAQATMFRIGCVTASQLSGLTGISRNTAQKTLKSLEKGKLANQRAPKLPWTLSEKGSKASRKGRPYSIYYLSRGNYDSAILEGAFAAGVEDAKQAKRLYARCQMPARATHGWLRNELFCALAEGCGEAGAQVPRESMWSESRPGFPLAELSHATNKVFPDGSFEVTWGGDLRCSFLVEAETNSRLKEVLRACFAGLRVERLLYALVHEKDLSHRPFRRRMGLLEDSPSSLQATG